MVFRLDDITSFTAIGNITSILLITIATDVSPYSYPSLSLILYIIPLGIIAKLYFERSKGHNYLLIGE